MPICYLHGKEFEYTLGNDGKTYIFNDGIDLSYMSLINLQGLVGFPERVMIYGDFDCSFNSLQDLFGHDVESLWIDGDFDISHNCLKSLFGLPKDITITGNFYCNNNFLTSLKDLPINIDGTIYCQANKIETLDTLPGYFKTTPKRKFNKV